MVQMRVEMETSQAGEAETSPRAGVAKGKKLELPQCLEKKRFWQEGPKHEERKSRRKG